jgi:recombination protein RecT
MTLEELNQHGNKYSQSFKNKKGVWKDNFDAMALKTVLKLLLSKQAPLSIDMQKAVLADQAVVKDVETEQFEYIDHAPEYNPVGMDLTDDDEMFQTVIKNIKSGDLDKVSVLSGEAGYTFSDEQKQIIVGA